jgi:hypothetical protein
VTIDLDSVRDFGPLRIVDVAESCRLAVVDLRVSRVPLTETLAERLWELLASMRAFEAAESLDDPERVVPWLYRIVRNTLIDEARAAATRQRRLYVTDLVPEIAEPVKEISCRCSVALVRELTPSYATILTLVDLGECW